MNKYLVVVIMLSVCFTTPALDIANAAARKRSTASELPCAHGYNSARVRCLNQKLVELTKQIAELKEAVSSKNANIAATDSYTKAEVDTKLKGAVQIQSANDTYTKAEIDAKLEEAARVRRSSDTYTKSEVDAKFTGGAPVDMSRFIKYGDKARIKVDSNTCLHSGTFAGFERCEIAGANGFYLDKPAE